MPQPSISSASLSTPLNMSAPALTWCLQPPAYSHHFGSIVCFYWCISTLLSMVAAASDTHHQLITKPSLTDTLCMSHMCPVIVGASSTERHSHSPNVGFCYRQQLAYQAYNPQLKPLSGPAQQAHPNPKTQIFPSHTLAILPNFATPQTLASPDGSIVFLQPDSYLHDAQDIVNHTADTVFGGSKAASQHQKSSAKLRGLPVSCRSPSLHLWCAMI